MFFDRKDILGDARGRRKTDLLMDDADAMLDWTRWPVEHDLLARNPHLARIGLEQARQRFDERRLSCAIFADKDMDGPARELEVDVGQDDIRPERLNQSRCFEKQRQTLMRLESTQAYLEGTSWRDFFAASPAGRLTVLKQCLEHVLASACTARSSAPSFKVSAARSTGRLGL